MSSTGVGLKLNAHVGGLTARAALVLALCLGATGCLQNGSKGSSSSGTAASSSTSGGGLTGATTPPGASLTAITLTQAIASNYDPSNFIDLIGQSGEIGTYCPTTTPCVCRLSWTDPTTGASLQTDAPPSYVEVNLARCAYDAARAAASFTLRLVVVATNASSNTFTITTPYSNPATNTANAQNYRRVTRFQCRDIVTANSSLYLNTLLDPQVWNLGYTFNLHTTSLGRDYGYAASGFECPVTPSYTLGAATNYMSSDGVYDMRIYSASPLAGDSTIYPANDVVNEQTTANRHDYFLAAFRSSTFRQGVCVPHTTRDGANSLTKTELDCDVDTSTNPATVGSDVIGFAAVPDSAEQCPNITLPTKRKWAKLWQFRTSLPARTIIDVTNVNEVGELYCTSSDAEWTGTSTTTNGYRYAVGPLPTWQLGVTLSSTASADFGNCRGASCTATDGTAPYDMRSGYGNTTGAACAGTGRDTYCTTPAVQFDALFPAAAASGAPGLTRAGGGFGGIGAAFSSAGLNGFISAPSTALRGRGGTHCNPTLPGDRFSQGFDGKDSWLMGNGSVGACIEADTDLTGRPYNDDSGAHIQTGGVAPLAAVIKNWFDFIGVSCPGDGSCSTLPTSPIAPASHSPTTSWGGYGLYQLAPRAVDLNSSADMMYVVTPTNITRAQMENPADATFLQYQPYRLINGTAVYYNLDSGSLDTAIPAQRLPIYPLCVLQEAL